MKILILSDSDSPHTIRWAKSLSQANVTVSVFSLHKPNFNLYSDCPNIRIHSLNLSRAIQFIGEAAYSKLIYLRAVRLVRKIIREDKPDILHSHYASSYGLIGALSKFQPFIVSVWGADIYNFPKRSFLHKSLIKFVLFYACKILSTSFVMKREIQNYTRKEIIVTPFGIDIEKFKPKKIESLFSPEDLVIGTIKTLEKKYGIEYLIKAFSLLKGKQKSKSLKLLIVGKGSQEEYLKNLVNELYIQKDTVFTGYISSDLVQDYHNMIDINVSVSIEDSESFGVAVLEASACGKPVIVSNAGGLPEVVEDGVTGYVVEKENLNTLVSALEKLVVDPELRILLGNNGRAKVISNYKWSESVLQMLSIYKEILNHLS